MGMLDELLADKKLYERMSQGAYHACRSFAQDADDLDDLIAGAWARLVANQDSIKRPENPVAFFVTVARNHGKDLEARRSREREKLADISLNIDALAWGGGRRNAGPASGA